LQTQQQGSTKETPAADKTRILGMKKILTACWMLCATFLAAQNVLDKPISGTFSGQTTAQLLENLEKQHDLRFYFQPNKLSNTPLSNLTFDNTPLGKVLATVLNPQGLTFVAYEDYAIIIATTSELNTAISENYLNQKQTLQTDEFPDAVVVGDKNAVSRSEKVTVRGKVIDGSNDKPVIGAFVVVESQKLNIATDTEGVFALELPVGLQTFEVKNAGFADNFQRVKVFGEGELTLKIYPKNIDLQEVVIRDAAKKNIRSTTIGVSELSIKQIKQLPSLMGEADVLKSLLTLPGVSNVGEGSSGFNVRGGNIDQNLILQDGAFILNPSHVLGLFSSFNPDAVKKVTLYKGHIPAQFGGRTSSVLDIKLKDGNMEKWSGFGGIGPISTKVLFEGPIVKGKTSLLIGGRTTYSDWVLNLVSDPNLKKSAAEFYDTNVKLTQKIGQKGTFNLSFYRSFDNFRYSDQFGYGWETTTGTAAYNHIFNEKLSLNLTAVYGDNKNNFSYRDALGEGFLDNGFRYGRGKLNVVWQPVKQHSFNFGAETNAYFSRPENFEQKADGETVIRENYEKTKGQEIALYANDEMELTDWLSLSVGVRQTFYRNVGSEMVYKYTEGLPKRAVNIIDSTFYGTGEPIKTYAGFEPRLSLAFIIDKTSSVKLSYNRLFQFLHLITNTTASTPVDIWQLSNTHVAPQRADNYSLGYFKNFDEDAWETSIEVYYKGIDNLVEYKDFSQLLRNRNIETELIPSRGRAYGAELFIKRNKGALTGYFSYSYSRSSRQTAGVLSDEIINSNTWFPSNFDRPHNANIVMNWQLRKTMALSANFVYNSGRPLTAPTYNFSLNAGYPYINYSDRNAQRIPDYYRLDLSYTITRAAVRTKRFKGSLTFSVYNALFRRNAFSIFFRKEGTAPAQAYQLAVLGTALPAVTYNFQF
jgi:hypothetical protein